MKAYSKELIDFIENNRMKYDVNKMVSEICLKFDKKVSAKTLRKYYYRHNLDYKKIYNRNFNCTWTRPVGFESPPDKNGLVRIKINDKQWQYKQRYLYEKYHNTKLSDNEFVIFADGDKNNFSKENLIAVSKDVAKTFYILTKGEIKNKQLTELGLKIAKIKNMIGGIEC